MPEKTKPAGGNGGQREIEIANWKTHERNTLRGFFDLILPSGLVIRDAMLHERNGKCWVSMPGKPYTEVDGTISYCNIVDFDSPDARQRFQAAALTAVQHYRDGARHE
jgi:hypothetical protein